MRKLTPVIGKAGLARDASGFIHNLNSKIEVDHIRLRKQKSLESRDEMNKLKEDVNTIQSEMKDIKSLLTQILEQL